MIGYHAPLTEIRQPRVDRSEHHFVQGLLEVGPGRLSRARARQVQIALAPREQLAGTR
jgi:hypothetical protein